ncbi:lipopolysaccharide biosynthesis protein [Myroides marinus]|uniref:MATE family efflux transporter n=1 Tax=Myroides marinus TaxID=703342 RepID=UPI0025752960|nr:MATE family efflux transporter [Myroides marinus]MDM1384257.1 lipopolysaccharide biosynthesis protein [Myroides marinus]
MSNSKTIAKNTLFLYFRMFLIMGVTLYTSRVVLQQLGVSDYGIYSLVGGIVAMLGFFNAAMSSATQRYLSFDIGKGDEQRLQKTFSATLTIHILIAVLALILAETIGLWYVNYKMVFPDDRLYAVNVVYQFSVLTFLLSIIQVPYNALIIARERMNVYAYVSILEAGLKLGIVFLLMLGEDKLILYSILIFVITFIIRLIYQFYCRKQFKESKYKFELDKVYFAELLAYSGWNLFGNFAAVARGQGVNMVLNLFFGTVVNAAYGITMQIQGAIQMFVTNFQMAVNPQIIKTYASGDKERMFNLVFQSSKFSYFLILLIVGPLIFNIDFILEFWLGEVPQTTNVFCQLALVMVLIDSLSGGLMTAIQATGKIKVYQIVVGTLVFLNLPISYLFLEIFETSPNVVFIIGVVISLISLLFRIYFLQKKVSLSSLKYIKKVLFPSFICSLVSVVVFCIIPLAKSIQIMDFLLNTGIYLIICLGSIVLFGTTKYEKIWLKQFILLKIKK